MNSWLPIRPTIEPLQTCLNFPLGILWAVGQYPIMNMKNETMDTQKLAPKIYRKEINFAQFQAPRRVTLDYQSQRQAFSVWFKSSDTQNFTYKLISTGEPTDFDFELVASCVASDGFTIFHLVRIVESKVNVNDLLANLEECVLHLEAPYDARPGARQRAIEKAKAGIAKAKGQS